MESPCFCLRLWVLPWEPLPPPRGTKCIALTPSTIPKSLRRPRKFFSRERTHRTQSGPEPPPNFRRQDWRQRNVWQGHEERKISRLHSPANHSPARSDGSLKKPREGGTPPMDCSAEKEFVLVQASLRSVRSFAAIHWVVVVPRWVFRGPRPSALLALATPGGRPFRKRKKDFLKDPPDRVVEASDENKSEHQLENTPADGAPVF